MMLSCFVQHQYLWHTAIKPEVCSYNIWGNRWRSGCSLIGEKSLWDRTVDNKLALVWVMAGHCTCDKPLPETMMSRSLAYTCLLLLNKIQDMTQNVNVSFIIFKTIQHVKSSCQWPLCLFTSNAHLHKKLFCHKHVVNPCNTEVILGSIMIYLNFLSFFKTNMASVVDIRSHGRQRPI